MDDAGEAVRLTAGGDPRLHARAWLALGRFQFNRGDYPAALATLAEACGDLDAVATARAEVAAYHLNRGELDQARQAYEAVDRLRRQIDPTGPSDHTLLMLGVVNRRLRHYDQAARYLAELIDRGRSHGDRAAVATGLHHLAWSWYEQNRLPEARRLGEAARAIYAEIRDPRGASDADEQLGLIAMAAGGLELAGTCLERSLAGRQALGNQQGVASTLRRLARLSLRQGHIPTGLRYRWQSLALYRRINALSWPRLVAVLAEVLGLRR